MTRQKTFKRKVRERMERTGESYATARAQLTGSDDAPSAGLHPHTAALRIALADVGIAVSEELVLLMSGGAGAAAMAFRYDAENFTSFYLSGWNPFQSDIREAVRRLGLHPDIHETTGAATAERALRERLATDGAQIAWVELGTLQSARREGSDPFLRVVEGYGVVVVLAFDGDGALVVDRDPRPFRVSAEGLAAARGRVRRDRHRLMAVGEGEADVAGAVRAGLERCAAGPEKPPSPGMSLEGIARWADRLHGARGKEAWERMFPPGPHRDKALRSLRNGIGDAGGGLMRRMQARGLLEAAALLGLPALVSVAAQTDALADGWDALAEASASESLEQLQRRVRDLYAEELSARESVAAVL